VASYLYCVPIQNDVRRYKITREVGGVTYFTVDGVEVSAVPKEEGGSPLIGPGGAEMFRETPEWLEKYQAALRWRVASQIVPVWVYGIAKRGKTHSWVNVVDGSGLTYQYKVPSVPLPEPGQFYEAVRSTLDITSLVPNLALLAKAKAGMVDGQGS